MQESVNFKIRGLNRDLSESAFNSDFAYDAKNIRITPLEDNSLLAVTNERGNKKINLDINGVVIGEINVDDSLILFSCNNDLYDIETENINVESILQDGVRKEVDFSIPFFSNYIYKLDSVSNKLEILYKGNLQFSLKYPIEAITQNDRVYWVDGLNPPRVINLKDTKDLNDYSFNFNTLMNSKETVVIEKQYDDIVGRFPSGVQQYFFTYIHKNGQESAIFYNSPLYYITHKDRGASAEESVVCSFKIEISDYDTSYEYIRIYSTTRTSLNNVVNAKKVVDIKISNYSDSESISYIDQGLYGSSIAPTDLLYKEKNTLVAGTINHKDNVLFLGDIKEKYTKVSDTIIETIKDIFKSTTFVRDAKTIKISDNAEVFYPHISKLDSSNNIKIFKGGEYYRLGVQLQDSYGNWSDPIYIKDCKNEYYPYSNKLISTEVQVAIPKIDITLDDTSYRLLIKSGYKNIRPVIVYPRPEERSVVCQGVLNPTVFNVEDRKRNSPSSVASWFFRPNLGFDIVEEKNKSWNVSLRDNDALKFEKLHADGYIYSQGGLTTNNFTWDAPIAYVDVPASPSADMFGTRKIEAQSLKLNSEDWKKMHSKGTYPEFRHMFPLPGDGHSRAREIESSAIVKKGENNNFEFNSASNTAFGIDSSIFTLNCPEITEDSIDMYSSYKFRIVGIIPITTSSNDLFLTTSSSPLNDTEGIKVFNEKHEVIKFIAPKFGLHYKNVIPNKTSPDLFASRSFITQPIYWDGWYNAYDMNYGEGGPGLNDRDATYGRFLFNIYPWQAKKSIGNGGTEEGAPSILKNKIIANTKVSVNTCYLINSNIAGASLNDVNDGYIKDSEIRLSKDNLIVFGDGSTYLGNYDKVISGHTYDLWGVSLNSILFFNETGESKHSLFVKYDDVTSDRLFDPNYVRYYPIVNNSQVFQGKYKDFVTEDKNNIPMTSSAPTHITYKSTPHLVINTPIKSDNLDIPKEILPTFSGINSRNDSKYFNFNNQTTILSKQNGVGGNFSNYTGLSNSSIGYGYLWLGELYKDVEEDFLFGGNSTSAIENNMWVPCGKSVPINESISLNWEEGDWYYQRYDCLKTFPASEDDQNGIVEVLSYMCETPINLEGRYDKNRGGLSNLHIRPTNFNLMNDVYSQENNYIIYRTIDKDRDLLTDVPHGIIWSLSNKVGDRTDAWTSIATTNILELDSNLGRITALKRRGNELIAFQPKGISNILYNQRVQIATNDNVPIQISNSGRVEGKKYLSEFTGTSNKWSIVETDKGFYYVDDYSKDIMLLSDSINKLSDSGGVSTWIKQLKSNNPWNLLTPLDSKDTVRTLYDKNSKDVYFRLGGEVLGYNEISDTFTSFYDYTEANFISSFNTDIISITSEGNLSYLWKQHRGDYNTFFGKYKPYWITYLVNPNPLIDKIFNNIEFRADTYNDNTLIKTDFNKLSVWNEYQSNEVELTREINKPSNLKQKFRIWRALIPRDKNGKDRIRNPWIYLKLMSDKPSINKTTLHDIGVYYF